MTNSQLSINQTLEHQGEADKCEKHNECHELDELIGPALESCRAPYRSGHLAGEVLERFWTRCVACTGGYLGPQDVLSHRVKEMRNSENLAFIQDLYAMFFRSILAHTDHNAAWDSEQELWYGLVRHRSLSLPTDDPQRLAKALDQLERIADLIEGGDPVAAAECLPEHFRTVSAEGNRSAEANPIEEKATIVEKKSTLLVDNVENESDRTIP